MEIWTNSFQGQLITMIYIKNNCDNNDKQFNMADLRHGIAGGIAGIAVDLVFYPLQTIKTRIMASTPGQNLRKIAVGKFKGFSCQMVVSFPYSFTFFYTYETFRRIFSDKWYKNVLASVMAQIFANLVRNPFEVVKQQLMTGRADKIRSSLTQIVRNRGVRGLYTGLQATLARDILFSAIQLPLFEYFRQNNSINLSKVYVAGLSGSLAAAIAGFCSCPLDVIKTRLMTQDFKLENAEDVVRKIYGEYGVKGFFKGSAFRCGILSFGGIVYFGSLQKARQVLGLEESSREM